MIISFFPQTSDALVPQFTYTGQYKIQTDGNGWRINFMTSGTLIFLANVDVDIFVCGAGGNGSTHNDVNWGTVTWYNLYGGGGGGGYTATQRNVSLTAYTEYAITVGTAGANSGGASSFGSICSANGGAKGTETSGGNGGSGGATGGAYNYSTKDGSYRSGQKTVEGGTNGGNGRKAGNTGIEYVPGTGQGTNTRAFGETSGTAYGAGGNAYWDGASVTGPSANTGNGGHGGGKGNTGASGIVIIRDKRA